MYIINKKNAIGDDLNRKAILEEMLYDEEEEFIKLAGKAKKVVNIKKSNGMPILLQKDRLTHEEQIGCFVLGKYYAKEMELTDTPITTIDEISEGLKLDKNIVRARLSNLSTKEIVERIDKGQFKISFIKLEEFLDGITTKIKTD